ncbi:related to ring finger protein 14 [Ustilago trichophora]|uniref:RBR-type E3 ubiquitin transferase n=1 Tax=Ustilago trichophora TaxID=86804 RepID=A0A5C3E8L9_9BASI|nr:related to ring finger protein 14 [Ustilago trichophora]
MDAEAVLEECRARQEDEIVALESIFAAPKDNEVSEGEDRPAELRVKLLQRKPEPVIEFYVPITLPRPTRIVVDTFANDVHRNSAQASSSKVTIQPQSGDAESPNLVSIEPEPEQPVHSKTKQRNGRNQRRKPGHLNAAANAFQPSTPASVASFEHSKYRTTVPNIPKGKEEDAADALGRLSLHSALALKPVPNQSRPSSPGGRSRTRSTKTLPALIHLAPVTLRVRLPSRYPAEQPPIVEVLTAPWLPDKPGRKDKSLLWILQKLDEQYRELSGMEVLYIWVTHLSEGLWAELLEEQSSSEDLPSFLQAPREGSESSEASLHFEEHLSSPDAPPRLAAQLVAHSRICSRTTFDTSSFDCAICLETRKGRACTRLTGCGHVFCLECLAAYLSSLVDDGFHRQAKRCPDPECVMLWSEREKQNLVDQEGNLITPAKAKRTAARSSNGQGDTGVEENAVTGLVTRAELESILGPTRLTRLDELTVKAKMEADPSVSYCPRSGCQAAVVRLPNDENSGHWERFRECLSCGFAFCAWCSRSWHGPTSCPVSFQSELIKRYLSLPASSPDRALMEQKFGRKTLETMARKYEEEQQTQQWLSDYTTPCPTCGIAIEKSYGCNHMTCKSCQTHYCYLCGKPISSQNPYLHFNTPGYECYHRLFDGLLGDQAPQAQQQGQGQGQGEEQARAAGRGANDVDGRPGFALLLDENGLPIHLEPEDQEMDFLAWQQLV